MGQPQQACLPWELLLSWGSATQPCLHYSSCCVTAVPVPGHWPCRSVPLSRAWNHRPTSWPVFVSATSLQTCLEVTGLCPILVNVFGPASDPDCLIPSWSSDLPPLALAATLVPAHLSGGAWGGALALLLVPSTLPPREPPALTAPWQKMIQPSATWGHLHHAEKVTMAQSKTLFFFP